MKGKVKNCLAAGFAFTILATGIFNTSAATPVSEDFTKGVSFVAAGDLNADGSLNTSDLVMLRKVLLGQKGVESKYADSNSDNRVNIIDLVHLKKDIAALKRPVIIEDGVLKLNGTAYFTGEVVSLLKPDTEYQISYDVITETGIKLSVKGAAEKSYDSGTGSKSFSHILKTGKSLTVNSGLELCLSGEGTIDNIVISEITDTWSDGDTKEQGGNDIF